MKDKEDDQHEESAQSADTKAFLKLVDAMFITGRRGDAEISDTFEFHFEESDNDEIRIFEKITFPLLDEAERMPLYYCIVIKKAWISRIITTLRTLPFEDYDINFPEGIWNRHIVHEYEECQVNLEFLPSAKDYATLQIMPIWKEKIVAKMLKAIHAQESKKAARQKAKAVAEELRAMKLKEAAKKVEDGIEETLAYCDFPSEHWARIRTNNVIERLNREIRRRTRVVGSFPDGNSALMLVCARLRHVAGTQWGNKKYMNMKHLEDALEDTSIAG